MNITQEQFDALTARMAAIEFEMGSSDVRVPAASFADPALRPPQLPSGDYQLFPSLTQIRYGLAECAAHLEEAERNIAALQTRPAANVVQAAPSIDIKAALQGLEIFTDETGRIGIGGPPIRDPRDNAPLMNYTLTIYGKGGAGTAYIGNTALDDAQRGGNNDPQRIHVGTDGIGGDDGRHRGKGALYRDKPLPDGSWDAYIPDEFRAVANDGLDSQSDFCWQRKEVVADGRGGGKMVSDVQNGTRIKSGQDLYLYLRDIVKMVAGKKIFQLRGSDGVFYDGNEPADTGRGL